MAKIYRIFARQILFNDKYDDFIQELHEEKIIDDDINII